MVHSKLVPNMAYAQLASDEQIERAAEALESHNIHVLIAASGEEAKNMLFDIIPEGAEVFTGNSLTLEALDISSEVEARYDSVRAKLSTMDRQTQWRDMVKLGAVPEYIVGSVHAVTEDGSVVVASMSGSQLAPYAASAAKVIWIVGAQKIVPTLEDAMKRVQEYTYPMEDEHVLQTLGMNSAINKLLVIHKEIIPGRTTMIIVKEELGF